jgi:hypothetical protein
VVMVALNGAGTEVARTSAVIPGSSEATPIRTNMTVTRATDDIATVIVEIDRSRPFLTNEGLALDDIEFETRVQPPLTPPVVTLLAPTNVNYDVVHNTLGVLGSVAGPEVVSARWILTEESGKLGPAAIQEALPLSSTGPDRWSFNSSIFSRRAIGNYHLAVEAVNRIGQTGRAEVRFTNFPDGVPAGSHVELGTFRYGDSAGAGCADAVYERGAVSLSLVDDSTRLVSGRIFTKWQAVVDHRLGTRDNLGCPLGLASDIIQPPWHAIVFRQAFDRGVIYDVPTSSGTTLPVGTFYVPNVLEEAGKKLRGASPMFTTVGLPIEDPQGDPHATLWLQRFQRFDADAVTATLQLRVEGGDRNQLHAALRGMDSEGRVFVPDGPAIPTSRMPTVMLRFPCEFRSDNLDRSPWTCTVGPTTRTRCPDDRPCPRMDDFVQQVCQGDTFDTTEGIKQQIAAVPFIGPQALKCVDFDGRHEVPHWGAVRGTLPFGTGDHTQTDTIAGFVLTSRFSSEDWAGSHFNCWHDFLGLGCQSDWNTHIRPMPEHRFMLAANLATDKLEIEWERTWSEEPFWTNIRTGREPSEYPRPGDFLYAYGRWIIDCGHGPFRSEIHSPQALVWSRTTTYRDREASRVAIWVNHFFDGRPVTFEMAAPPKPSPNATLVVARPRAYEFNNARFVEPAVETNWDMGGTISMTFTAPPITAWMSCEGVQGYPADDPERTIRRGEPLREYAGVWYVYWQE